MKHWTFLILLLLTIRLIGQEPFMMQYTNEKGLPSMTVYQIIQDRQGYIWIGSAKGLSRYDGRKYVTIDLSSLLDKEIIFLNEDYLGRIWINNLSGQVGWIEDMKLKIVEFEGMPESVLPVRFDIYNTTLLLNYTKKGRQLAIYNLESDGSFTKKPFTSKRSKRIKLAQLDFNNTMYFEHISYKNNNLCFNYYQNDSIKTNCVNHHFADIEIDEEEFILRGVDNHERFLLENKSVLLRYDADKNVSEFIYDCSKNRINGCRVKEGKIWVFTKNGIIIFDEFSLDMEMTLLEGINSHTFFEDREKNLWLPTAANGIFLLYNINSRTYNSKNSDLPKSDIYSLYLDTDNNQLYIGLSGGHLSRKDLKNQKFVNHKLPLSGRVVALEVGENNNLWMGLDDGLCSMDLTGGKIERTNISYAIKALKQSSNMEMWYGSSAWAAKWNNNTPRPIKEQDKKVLFKRISSIEEDSNSCIWIGTTHGLYRYESDSIMTFFGDESGKKYSITGIEKTRDGSLWVATANEGLLRIKDDRIIAQLSRKDGLTSNNCRNIYYFEGQLFVGTDNGLDIIDDNLELDSKVNIRDGLPSGEVNCVTTDGTTIWMGTPKGLVTINFEDIDNSDKPPPIILEGYNVNGESYELTYATKFEYWQNTFDFDFVGIDIKSNKKESYRYRLIGLDDEWYSTKSQVARFHTLQPGDYKFEVKTVNDIGIESSSSADFEFSISGPWWKSTWFYIGSTLMIFTSFGSLLFWRVRERRKRESIERELKERIHQLKSEALKSQMNPHFIYNSLNAIQDFFVTHDDESALLYLSKFAHMIRLIFDYSGKDSISFHEEIEFVSLYLDLEKLRFGDRVEVVFDIEGVLKDTMLDYEVPPLLLQPIIENVFKHGLMHKLEGGKVKILFKKEDEHIKCIVEDNGIGRQASNKMKNWRQKKRSYGGLQALEERLLLRGKKTNKKPLEIIDLENSNGDSLGTRIIVIL